MQTIGLTGGIGSGKSTIARILKQLGYAVYIADTEASRLINTHPLIRQALIQHFGTAIYHNNCTLNKPLLAGIIFDNPQALQTVNQIVHPRVMDDFRNWSRKQTTNPVFFESAILFESGLNFFFQSVVCVTAPEETRIQRVVKRDQTTPQKVKERIRNQSDDTEKCRRADFIIYNDEEHKVIEQVLCLLKKLNNSASQSY